jgi:cell division protein ZapD
MATIVTFEQPLNEKVRNLLRLEFLFRQANVALQGQSPWESRWFIDTLGEILTLLSRSDMKTEFIKESERHIAALERFKKDDTLDQEHLSNIIRHLDNLRTELHGTGGQLGRRLKQDPFLSSIGQRSTIPGGTCEADLPAFHLWLSQPASERQQRQRTWLDELKLVSQGSELLLKLIRGSAAPTSEMAVSGGFLKNLDRAVPYQLIRVTVDGELGVYPEISAGRHRFTIRFMEPGDGPDRQSERDIPFRLTCCAF